MVVAVRGYTDGEGIFVLTIDDEVYVKRLQWNPASKKIVVKSENERYEPFEIEPDRITILGKDRGECNSFCGHSLLASRKKGNNL